MMGRGEAMTLGSGHALHRFLSRAGGPALVLHDSANADLLTGLESEDIHVQPVAGHVPGAPRRWKAVALVVADALSLRQSVSVLPLLGRTRLFAWWLVETAEPALVVPRPEWPTVTTLHATPLRSGGALTTLRAASPVWVNFVLDEVARTVCPAASGQSGVVVATTSDDPDHAPPADAGFIVAATAAAAVDPDREVPPDVVLTADPGQAPLPEHSTIARAPALVSEPDLLAGPLDEGLLNPAGFLRHPERGEVRLTVDTEQRVLLTGGGFDQPLPRGVVTPPVVSQLRVHTGVHVAWADPAPPAQVRAVTSLAMAGVPLVGGPPPPSEASGPRLGAGLARALADPADVSRSLLREERSVRLRRVALLEHSTLAWRERLAAAAGVAFRRFPTCSVVLYTRRPQRLELALQQVNRQRGVDLELVLVAQGFSPDALSVRGQMAHPVSVVEVGDSGVRADALNAGVAAASGDLVVTMHDDDWYGPDFVADLLLARHYSGAALVGTPTEFVYLEELGRTLRRATHSERAATTVGAGTMMIGRGHLRELGGFRRQSDGDAGLAADVRSRRDHVYRTHGLGHVLRRGGQGYARTVGSEPPDEWRIDELWDGFRPSQLLEHLADRKETR